MWGPGKASDSKGNSWHSFFLDVREFPTRCSEDNLPEISLENPVNQNIMAWDTIINRVNYMSLTRQCCAQSHCSSDWLMDWVSRFILTENPYKLWPKHDGWAQNVRAYMFTISDTDHRSMTVPRERFRLVTWFASKLTRQMSEEGDDTLIKRNHQESTTYCVSVQF